MSGFDRNPIYAILEAPDRWLIMAGLSALACLLGTIMMLAYGAPHWLARIWLYLALATTLVFLWLAAMEWRERLPADIKGPAPDIRPLDGEALAHSED